MKAILVIDEMPSRCFECPYHKTVDGEDENEFKVICNVRYWKEPNQPVENLEERPSWCPLKPLPQRQNEDEEKSSLEYIYEAKTLDEFQSRGASYLYGHIDGWNACLEEIENDSNKTD